MTDRQAMLKVVNTLRQAGYQALLAGGCVRDMLLGIEPCDYDVATNAVPEKVMSLFRRTIAVGAQFGVVVVLCDDFQTQRWLSKRYCGYGGADVYPCYPR